MTGFQQIKTTLNILTRGWFVRVFIVLLWLISIMASFFLKAEPHIIAILIVFSNAFLYLQIASRIQMLAHSTNSKILPHYFTLLKKSLAALLMVSLLPALVLLPHYSLFLMLISGCLFMSILIVAMTYQAKFYWAFIFLIVTPLSLDKEVTHWLMVNLTPLLIVVLPVLLWLTYYLLTRLDTFKGDEKHIARVIALTTVNMKKSFVSQDDIPLKSRNRAWQWLIKNNFEQYRQLINRPTRMTTNQLIETSCQSVASIGRYTYLFWMLLAILFALAGSQFSDSIQGFFIPVMISFPAVIVGTGSIGIFQIINNKKSLLTRLAILPIFHSKQTFNSTFITFIIMSQTKFYGVIYLIIALLVSSSFEHLSASVYINMVLAGVMFCTFNLVIMLWNWSSQHPQENLGLWLMVVLFICYMVFFVIILQDQQIKLWQNSIFVSLLFISASLFMLMRKRCLNNLFH